MIRNERQYRVTKAQLRAFEDSLHQIGIAKAPQRIDPVLIEAQRRALQSQHEELASELAEYETLRSGEVASFEVESITELPIALIKARVALGLTQKDLATRLGVKEQQVQRWEASDYSSAGIDALKQVMEALGVETREEVFVPNNRLTAKAFLNHLENAGIPKDLTLNRLIPPTVAAVFQNGGAPKPELRDFLRAATGVSRVFGARVRELVSLSPLPPLAFDAVAAARFKLPARSAGRVVTAYTVYAHYLAGLLESCVVSQVANSLPSDFHEMHRLLTKPNEPITLLKALTFLWDCGVIVLPLRDPGVFHGAVWKIRKRYVIVLKQSTPLESRWLYDLLHETGHVAHGHVTDDAALIEDHPISPEIRDREEDEANNWAEDVLLDGNSDKIEEACSIACEGNLRRLKQTIPEIARRFNLDAGIVANHMAYRLASEGFDWWGAAQNLQNDATDPFDTARSVLLDRVNLQVLNPIDRDLLLRPLTEK